MTGPDDDDDDSGPEVLMLTDSVRPISVLRGSMFGVWIVQGCSRVPTVLVLLGCPPCVNSLATFTKLRCCFGSMKLVGQLGSLHAGR